MWRTRGHDAAVELLTSSLGQDRVSHAYLITGPERTGKATLARELAMALNCTTWQGAPQGGLFGPSEAPTAEPGPCYQCASCLKTLAGSHPDVFAVEEWTTERGAMTDQVRAIQYGSGLLPFEGRRKVYLLLNADGMTPAAQNTLLKTLEEPAPTVCLILTATTTRALLPTVVSRCQQLQLRPPSMEAITSALVELREMDPEEAGRLAALAAGRIGWALAAAEGPELLERRQAALDALAEALRGRTVRRFRIAESLAGSNAEGVDDVLELWLSWLRDVLLAHEGLPERIVNRDQLGTIQAVAAELSTRDLQQAIRSVQTARSQVAGAINTRMALEVLMLRMPALRAA
ncbi:MAG TPA: DNA polymerase III subunit delta' C-terminal domain-containing protein [Chloroflexota bacterium]|nr:DNA polymerase III subunit delta' C-terminal domain-containing protein [Chloroflexota bacterium]